MWSFRHKPHRVERVLGTHTSSGNATDRLGLSILIIDSRERNQGKSSADADCLACLSPTWPLEFEHRLYTKRLGLSPFLAALADDYSIVIEGVNLALFVCRDGVTMSGRCAGRESVALDSTTAGLMWSNRFKEVDLPSLFARNQVLALDNALWECLVAIFAPAADVFWSSTNSAGSADLTLVELDERDAAVEQSLRGDGAAYLVRNHAKYATFAGLSIDAFVRGYSNECEELCRYLIQAQNHDSVSERVYWHRNDYEFFTRRFCTVASTTRCRRHFESFVTSKNAISNLHRDAYSGEVSVFFGRRRFHIYPPKWSNHLYPFPFIRGDNNKSWFVPYKPDYVKYPLAAMAVVQSVEIGPGDLLYLPGGWFHWVETLEASLCLKEITGILDGSVSVPGL